MKTVQFYLVVRTPWWTSSLIALGKLNLLLGLPVDPEALAALIIRHTKTDIVEKPSERS